MNITTSIKATLRDGELTVVVTATAPYGEGDRARTASVTKEIHASASLKDALAAELEAHEAGIKSQANFAAFQALERAIRLGEEI